MSGNIYFEIVAADNQEITQIPVLLIVVGCFVLLLGIVGVVGAICAGTIGGRIILGLVCSSWKDRERFFKYFSFEKLSIPVT